MNSNGIWDCLEDVNGNSTNDCHEMTCGDASMDGVVNSIDARLVQRCAVGLIPCPSNLFCDVSGDGECNSLDARLIQRFAVGQIPESALKCPHEGPPLSASDVQNLDGDKCLRWLEDLEGASDSNPDTDGDGLVDCEAGYGTDPSGPDTDDDGLIDGVDNCPLIANASQAETGVYSLPVKCQCGDGNLDDNVDLTDITAINDIILGYAPMHGLADTNLDGSVNLSDIFRVNDIIFGSCAGICPSYPPLMLDDPMDACQ